MSGLNHITASGYINLFKEIILSSLDSEDTIIGGDEIVVEIDESKFGKINKNKDELWIFGGIERTPEKKIFLVHVKDRTSSTLINKIQKHIRVGSIIYSDMWKGYCKLGQYGFSHLTVNHSKYFRDPITKVFTNTIEGIWSGIKQILPNHMKTEDNINSKLFEIIWRRKNKNNDWNSFLNAMKKIHVE
jgi:transposase-like protein